MAVATQITIDPRHEQELKELLREVPNGLPTAMRAAVNRTGRWAKTRTLKAVTSNLNIKRKDIDANAKGAHRYGGVKLSLAGRRAEPTATVNISGRRIPVYRFAPKPAAVYDQIEMSREANARRRAGRKIPQSLSGVTYKIDKGGARKRAPHTFVARMASGHISVFIRKGKDRFPLRELMGPSIPHVAEQRSEFKSMLAVDAGRELHKQLDSQVDRLLKRQKAQATGGTDG
jgi:hypothetical protein